MRLKFLIPAVLVTCSLAGVISCVHTSSEFPADILSGTITDEQISEASGITVSRVNPDLIWLNNDSENGAALYGVNEQGKHLATMHISGTTNIDWEDLASFEYNQKSYIVIADVGNNAVERNRYFLHIIQEPKLDLTSDSVNTVNVSPEWSIEFTYEDGARDCEAVAVDIHSKKILLLSKRDKPPVLYELQLNKNPHQVAKKLGEISEIPKPVQLRFGSLDMLGYSNMPTAMDISPDGTKAVVLTYSAAYLFKHNPGSSWLTTFSSSPERITYPLLKQAESIGFDVEGEQIYITSERLPAPILKMPIR